MNYKRNNEVRSHNNWCRRKAISITCHRSLNHSAGNAHVPNQWRTEGGGFGGVQTLPEILKF
jgi:hypothetical protein